MTNPDRSRFRFEPPGEMAPAEPAWHALSTHLARGLREPITVSQHSHGSTLSGRMAQQDEAEITVGMMTRMDVDCDEVGFHRHDGLLPHHHHDLRCLVEAGANEVRPDLRQARETVDRQRRDLTRLRGQVDDLRLQASQAHNRFEAAQASLEQAFRFMESMPAKGPWATVYDQYVAWVDEQAEEASNG